MGRDPLADIWLSDRSIAPHHATLSRHGGQLLIAPATPGAPLRVNGLPRYGPVVLRPGDLIQLAAVALTVIRPTAVNGATEPAASVPVPVAPPAPPIARPAATIAVRSTEPQRRVVPNGGLLALVALAGGLIARPGVSRPGGAGGGGGTTHLGLSPRPLVALTAFALVGALAVGAVWPVFEFTARSDRDRALAALASTGAGGLLAGVACALLAWPSPGGRLAGAPGALLFAGLTLACAGVGRI
ncbi:MAG TPA: FHA domain-containing protein, partial [Miltoncostaeaceae bacterium]|nr:FHA domain-containing protein [Miltoncostaeaceae bacterium]